MRPDCQLARDARKRPDLFLWHGPEPIERLNEWAKSIEGRVPEELVSFWASTGGGDVFETETLLSPFGDPAVGDDVASVTSFHRERGLQREWVVFHVGWGMSAFSVKDGRYAWFEGRSYSPSRAFKSLDDWYCSVLRAEYGERYGL